MADSSSSKDIERFSNNFRYYLEHPLTGDAVVSFMGVREGTSGNRNLLVRCEVPIGKITSGRSCHEVCKMDGFGVGNFVSHHLVTHHPEYINPDVLKRRLEAVKSSSPSQSTLNFSAANLSAATPELFASVAAVGCLPLSFTESLWFRYMWCALYGTAALQHIPSRFMVTKAADSLSRTKISEMETRIEMARSGSSTPCPLSVSIDFWSNRQGTSYFCCIGRILNADMEVEEHVLSCQAFSGTHDAKVVAECMQKVPFLRDIPFNLRSLTSDGGSDIASMQGNPAIAYCKQPYFVSCVNHKFHTIITDTVKGLLQKSVIPKQIDVVIKAFSSSGVRQQKLTAQMLEEKKRPLKILMHVPNRWNSLAVSWGRLLRDDVFSSILALANRKEGGKFILKFNKAKQRNTFLQALSDINDNRSSILVVSAALMDILACTTALQRQNGITLSRAFFVLIYCRRLFDFIDATRTGFAKQFAQLFLKAFDGDLNNKRQSERYASIPLIFRVAAFLDPETYSFWSSETTKIAHESESVVNAGKISAQEKEIAIHKIFDAEVVPIRDFVVERAKDLYDAGFMSSKSPLASDTPPTSSMESYILSKVVSDSFNSSSAISEFSALHLALMKAKDETASTFYSNSAKFPMLKLAIRSILSQGASAANVEAFWSFMGRQDSERRPLYSQRLANLGFLGVTLRKEIEASFLANGIEVPGYLRKPLEKSNQERGKLAMNEKDAYLSSRILASEILKAAIQKSKILEKPLIPDMDQVLKTPLVPISEELLDEFSVQLREDSEEVEDFDSGDDEEDEDEFVDDGETEDAETEDDEEDMDGNGTLLLQGKRPNSGSSSSNISSKSHRTN